MSDILVPASQIEYNPFSDLEGRKDLDPTRYAYKLTTPGNYGLDVVLGDDLGINESKMSCWINFADGNSRDGVGDITEVAGIDCERHRKNPIVLFDHGKKCELPIALAENPDNKTYTVNLDPVGRVGKAETFFYQGKSGDGLEKNHAQFCYDIFDMLAKKFIRGGSFAYQIKRAERLQPDYTQGTPPGLHLLSTRLLELGPTVIPAHQDTVMKMLDMPGRSDIFYKSLQPYVVSRPEMVVGGWDSKAHSSHAYAVDKLERAERKETDSMRRAHLSGRTDRHAHEFTRELLEGKHDKSKEGEKAFGVNQIKKGRHGPEERYEAIAEARQHHSARRGALKKGPIGKVTAPHKRVGKQFIPKQEGTNFEKVRGEQPAPQRSARILAAKKAKEQRIHSSYVEDAKEQKTNYRRRDDVRMLAHKNTHKPSARQAEEYHTPEDKDEKSYHIKSLREKYSKRLQVRRKGIKPFHSEQDDYESLETADSPFPKGFPAEIDRGQKRHPEGPAYEHRENRIVKADIERGSKPYIRNHEERLKWKDYRKDPPPQRGQKSQPSDEIDSDKACQIKRDGTAQGHKLSKKQEGMFGAACGKGKKAMENKGLEDATTNPETKERQELLQEGDAVGMEMVEPSIKEIRSKYQKKKGMARCLKKSVPGSFMVHVEGKYLEAMKSAAGKHGVKCECGQEQGGTHKVRLTGLDDAVHKLAGKYGKPGTIGKKGVEIESDERKNMSERRPGQSRDSFIRETIAKEREKNKFHQRAVSEARSDKDRMDPRDILDLKDDEKAINPPKLERNKIQQSLNRDRQYHASKYGHPDPEGARRGMDAAYGKIKPGMRGPTMDENINNRKGLDKSERNIQKQRLNRDDQRIAHRKVASGRFNDLESAGRDNVAIREKFNLPKGSRRKGLEFNIKIQCPNPEYVIQKAQLFGIGAWEDDGGVVLSGIDEVEIGRFLRQFKIMDDAQIAILFGGRLAGHKSYEPTPEDEKIHHQTRDLQRARKTESREYKLDKYVRSDARNAVGEARAKLHKILRDKEGKKAIPSYFTNVSPEKARQMGYEAALKGLSKSINPFR